MKVTKVLIKLIFTSILILISCKKPLVEKLVKVKKIQVSSESIKKYMNDLNFNNIKHKKQFIISWNKTNNEYDTIEVFYKKENESEDILEGSINND